MGMLTSAYDLSYKVYAKVTEAAIANVKRAKIFQIGKRVVKQFEAIIVKITRM